MEVECMVVATTINKLLWTCHLLSALCLLLTSPSISFCDNQSYITLAKNSRFLYKSKHIVMCYHFLYEKVDQQFILCYIPIG
ncbi:unnamed protein product [Sphagnum jensenii]|uniref:Uncharacterized protein n=2 Tax=Sphagnum jensenii TaxID=128206 RepID=A0ABP0VSL3_9BRYO